MKSNTLKEEKEFDSVKTFRDIKEKISLEMVNMDFEKIKEYLKLKSQKFRLKKDDQ